MQSLSPSPEASYRTVREGLSKMISHEGVLTPVKGVNAVILGAGPAHALYFSAYENIKKRYGSSNPLLNDVVNGEHFYIFLIFIFIIQPNFMTLQ